MNWWLCAAVFVYRSRRDCARQEPKFQCLMDVCNWRTDAEGCASVSTPESRDVLESHLCGARESWSIPVLELHLCGSSKLHPKVARAQRSSFYSSPPDHSVVWLLCLWVELLMLRVIFLVKKAPSQRYVRSCCRSHLWWCISLVT